MLELRLLSDNDVSLVEAWLNKEHVKRWIFSFPDAQRVTADIDKENKASEKALLACGFSLLDTGSSRYIIER